MGNARRWYIYLVSAISLQAVTWATIELLRNLTIFGINRLAIAFQVSVIVVGLPVFLGHWIWGLRLVEKSPEERTATLRRVYLYLTMASCLEPIIYNTFDVFRRSFRGDSQTLGYFYRNLSLSEAVIFHLIPILILGALWFYHYRVAQEESKDVSETPGGATMRQLYIYGFSAAGLTMTTMAIIGIIDWIMFSLRASGTAILTGQHIWLSDEIIRLVIGTALWMTFWSWAERLFRSGSEEEQETVIRKVYLYAAIFIGAMGVVGNLTGVIASLLRRVLGAGSSGSEQFPLPMLIGMGLVWFYHARVIRSDAEKTVETEKQANIRRINYYLIAAIGASALLVGICGDISVLLRSISRSFGTGLKEELALFTAGIIAGLPVWIIPWQIVQGKVEQEGAPGELERSSTVRKVYLYFFLFLAAITVLSSVVYLIYRFLSMILGEAPPTISELGNAIAFSIIALPVWWYHWDLLRKDGEFIRKEQTNTLEGMRIAIIDVDSGHFGEKVVEALSRDFPEISLEPIMLTAEPLEKKEAARISELITTAGLIIGPWEIAVAGGAHGRVSSRIAEAVVSSEARKILAPFRSDQWEWAGVDDLDPKAVVNQTVRAIKQVMNGEEVKAHKSLGTGAIIGIVIAVIILLSFLVIPLIGFLLY